MRAATFTQTGPAREVLRVGELPTPTPGPGEVRVRIATSGINPSDVRRRGAPPPGSPAEFPVVIPHSDGAGTIDLVGEGVPPARLGQRVWIYNAQWERAFGTAAEYCVLPEPLVVPLPERVDFAAGACLGIPALTAYHAVMLDGPVPAQTLLVQGGGGAVAFYAIQFAKACGAVVISTVSSDEKARHAREAGADHIVNYKTEDLVARVKDITAGRGVDRIIEVALAANAMTYPDLLVEHGTAVIYGTGGRDLRLPGGLLRMSATLKFILVYTLRPPERSAAIKAIELMMLDGSLKHAIGARFPLDRIAEAHERVEQGSLGNVILDLS